MNQEERDWLEWLKRAQDGVVTQRHAAEKMCVSERWVRKLLVRMKTDGDGVVVHGVRGRSSNRRIDEKTRARAIKLLKQPEWHDFGPTSASEQLAKRYGIDVSKETVRGWMVAAEL
jgi:transposase